MGKTVLCMAFVCAMLSACATAPRWGEVPLPAPPAQDGNPPPVAGNSADSATPPQPVAPDQAQDLGTEVVLQPYDSVRFRFLYWPELDDEQVIRPDGKVALLMVGEVQAQGKTPEQLQNDLLALYASKINEPEINVVVTNLASNRVYVGGEVATPGLILIQGRLTALGAIMQAGGFLEHSAQKANVVIVRQQGGKQYARTIDLRDAIERAESDAFLMQPYDVVYVPKTKIAKANQFVEQYIDNIIPRHLNWSFSTQLFQKKMGGNVQTYPISLGVTTPKAK